MDTADDKLVPLKASFLEYFRDVPIQKLAAAYIGRDEDTILRWKKEDADFADQISKAKAEWARKNVKAGGQKQRVAAQAHYTGRLLREEDSRR